MPGPAPAPTALKILRGNPGRRPLNLDAEASKINEIPVPLDFLWGHKRKLFIETAIDLHKMGIVSKTDGIALSWLCYAVAEVRDLAEKKQRSVGKDRSAIAAIFEKAHDRMLSLLREFGMTPSARSKIRVSLVDKGPSIWDEIDAMEQ